MENQQIEKLCDGVGILFQDGVYYIFNETFDFEMDGEFKNHPLLSASKDRQEAIEKAFKHIAPKYLKAVELITTFVDSVEIHSYNSPVEADSITFLQEGEEDPVSGVCICKKTGKCNLSYA